MGFFEDITETVTDTFENLVEAGGQIIAAPVQIAGHIFQGGGIEEIGKDILETGKRTLGAGGQIMGGALLNADPVQRMLENKDVDKWTLGLSGDIAGTARISDDLIGGNEISQESWDDFARLGIKGVAIGTGAYVVGEASSAASVGGWSWEGASLSGMIPELSTTNVLLGASVAGSLSKGDVRGAAEQLGVPGQLTGLIPGADSRGPVGQPGVGVAPRPVVPSAAAPSYGGGGGVGYVAPSSPNMLLIAGGLMAAIGIAYLAARRG